MEAQDRMNCPVCEGRMRAVEKHGVEIDICPDCKGIWLDRGELEKILGMFEQGGPAVSERRESRPGSERDRPAGTDGYERRDRDYDRDRYPAHDREREHGREYCNHDDDRHIDPRTGRRRRKGSWLGEIFDAFGGGDD